MFELTNIHHQGFLAQSTAVATTRLMSNCAASSSSQNKQTCTDFRLLGILEHAARLTDPRQVSPELKVCMFICVYVIREIRRGN